MKQKYFIGIDIGGTNIRIGLVDSKGNLLHFEMENSKNILSDKPVDNLSEFIKAYINKNVTYSILGAVIGFPSTVDKDRKVLLSTPNIPGLNQLDIVNQLEKLIRIPVYIDRDVNLLLQYDIYSNNFGEKGIVLGFYIGTGFGNAIQIDGRLLIGSNGSAGELGHIPLIKDETPCECGNKGCVEVYASGKRLQYLKDKHFPGTIVGEVFNKHSDDPIIQEYIEYLAIPIAIEINIFDPDYIILGGGVLQMEGFPYDDLQAHIYEHVRKPYPAENLKYYYSHADQTNGVIGAGIYGFRKIEEDTNDSIR